MKVDVYFGGVESSKTPKTFDIEAENISDLKKEVVIKLQSNRFQNGDYDIIVTDENDELIGGFWTEKKCGVLSKLIKWA